MLDQLCTQPWHRQARLMAARGATQREIAQAVGRSRNAVALLLNPRAYAARLARQRQRYREEPEFRARRLGVPADQLRPVQGSRQPKTAAEGRHRLATLPWHGEAIRLHALGLNYAQIGRAVGRCDTTVRCFLDRDARRKWQDYQNAHRRQRYRDDPEYRHAMKVRACLGAPPP